MLSSLGDDGLYNYLTKHLVANILRIDVQGQQE
jgi:hypothetical protein